MKEYIRGWIGYHPYPTDGAPNYEFDLGRQQRESEKLRREQARLNAKPAPLGTLLVMVEMGIIGYGIWCYFLPLGTWFADPVPGWWSKVVGIGDAIFVFGLLGLFFQSEVAWFILSIVFSLCWTLAAGFFLYPASIWGWLGIAAILPVGVVVHAAALSEMDAQ